VSLRTIRTALAGAALVAAAPFLGAGAARAHPHVWVTTETTVLYENGTIIGLRQKWSFDDFYTAMALQGLDTNNDGVYDRGELVELAKVNMDGLKEFGYFTTVKLSTEKLTFGAPKDFWLEHSEAPEGAVEVTVKTGDAAFEGTGAETVKPQAAAPASESFFARARRWMFGGEPDTAKAAEAEPPGRPKVLSLHFTLPLAQPVLADAPGFSFTITDPSFFIALQPAAKDPVVLGPGAPGNCRVKIGEAPDTAAASPPSADAKAATESNPAADVNRLGDALAQQFGGQSVAFGMVKPATITCGPHS
jgi:ABC-type uncharacterized transport system substrate-binding protein